MNKIFSKLLLLAMLILIVPASALLAGCGATPVNAAQGVSFLSNEQENGQAVFSLDLNSPLKLPYKINPSSAHGYSPRFTAVSGISGDNMETYSLDIVTGEFCIKRDDFKDVEVEITVGSFTDTCKIKLKTYPTKIGIYDESQPDKLNTAPKINLATGASYQINIGGLFGTETRLMSDSQYNFLIEASESSQTIINISNNNRLSFTAYNNIGPATVKVALCDYFGNVFKDGEGNALYAFEIEVYVYMKSASMDIKIDGLDLLVSSENLQNEYVLTASQVDYDLNTAIYSIGFEADFYDSYGRLIDDGSLELNCFVDKTTFITVDNDAKIIYLRTPPSGGSFVINVEMWSNAPLGSGEYCMARFKIRIKF